MKTIKLQVSQIQSTAVDYRGITAVPLSSLLLIHKILVIPMKIMHNTKSPLSPDVVTVPDHSL